jgi:rhamnogalacturonan endolyase
MSRKAMVTLAASVACCAVGPTAGRLASAAVTYTSNSSTITVNNARVSFQVSKSSGTMASLKLDGTELVTSNGGGYFDLNDSVYGYFQIGRHDTAATTYSVRAGPGWVDTVITHAASSVLPLTLKHHYVLRDGETGFHVYTEVAHDSARVADTIGQARFVLRTDPAKFNQHSITDTRFGVMPTATELIAAPAVQDATDDLQGLGSAYPKRYYTKYDWSVYMNETNVHGTTGSNYGAWVVQPNKEYLNGGPMKQELTVHQTDTTPALIATYLSGHYGSKSTTFEAGYSKTYGPFYLHLNTGPTLDAMRQNAKTFDDVGVHASFYDSLGIPGYATTAQRGRVVGSIGLPGNVPMAGATVVLSANSTEWQRASGPDQYWTTADANGNFDLSRVKPGTYRLSAYTTGQFGEYVQDNFTVSGNGVVQNAGSLRWTPANYGGNIWQLGTPDRTAGEFRHGNEYRNYGFKDQFTTEFPGGSVVYKVGTSNPATDWNYAQWMTINGVSMPQWQLKFDLPKTPSPLYTATLTVAMANADTDGLGLFVNAFHPSRRLDVSMPDPTDWGNADVRSGKSGIYQLRTFTIPIAWLKSGTNTLWFHVGTGRDSILYDAMRFEVNALAGDANLDGLVNFDDLLALAAKYGQLANQTWLNGDFDENGTVNFDDLLLLASNYNTAAASAPGWSAATLIPEPASTAAAAITLTSVLMRRRRLP